MGAEESVVPLSGLKELQAKVRELERLLGRKTIEVEILKDAIRIDREKKLLLRPPFFIKTLKNEEVYLWEYRCLMRKYRERFPKAVGTLEDGLEDALQYYAFDNFDSRKISSTNTLERINKEIRRRSRVVGIFPNPEVYTRMIACYLMEYAEDWSTGKTYISKNVIEEHRAKILKAA